MRDEGLNHVVSLNEEVKQVVTTAQRIELVALNAIIIAKRVGLGGAGFVVISDELRRFSRELRAMMDVVRQSSLATVRLHSLQIRQSRYDVLLRRAGLEFPATALKEELKKSRRSLGRLLDEAAKLSRSADIITRSAKIEAAYAGEFTAQLAEISAVFDGHLQTVRPILVRLESDLKS